MDIQIMVDFQDKQIELHGVEYSCDGSAEYQIVSKDWDEAGAFLTREKLVLDDVNVARWDGEDWINAPEVVDDVELVEKLIFYLEE